MGFEAEFLESIPYFNRPGVRFPNQAKFHPIKYLSALAKIIPGKGSHIFENTPAESFEPKPLTVHSGSHKIRRDYITSSGGLPFIGETANQQFAATGFCGKRIYPWHSRRDDGHRRLSGQEEPFE